MIRERKKSEKKSVLHPDFSLSRISLRDEYDTSDLKDMIINECRNSFPDLAMVMSSIGSMTNLEIVEIRVKTHEVDKESYQTFEREYLSEKQFSKRRKKNKLKTSYHLKKKTWCKF